MNGEIEVFLDVVGRQRGDDEILEAVTLVGPSIEVRDFPEDDTEYWSFPRTGTDFVYVGSTLDSILIRTLRDFSDPDYLTYPNVDRLIDGLGSTPTKAEVIALLGSPEKQTAEAIRYAVSGKFIVFSVGADDKVKMISVAAIAL